MKKALILILCLVLALGCIGVLVACDPGTTPQDPDPNPNPNPDPNPNPGITFNGDIDEDTWSTAFAALPNVRNFTVTVEASDDISMEVVSNKVHVKGGEELYFLFSEDGVVSYELYGDVWMPEDFDYDGDFDTFVQAYIDYFAADTIATLAESYSSFTYDATAKAFVWQTAEGDSTVSYEVKFVNSSVYSFKKVSSDGQGNDETLFVDKINYTEFEFVPLHEHEFDTEWSSNGVYHWHEALCHEGETDGKVPHNWGADNKCIECGYAKPETTNDQVDKETFDSAMQLKGLTNWSLTVVEENGNTVIAKRQGNTMEITIQGVLRYLAIDSDGKAWTYFEVSDGVWEKIDGAESGTDATSALYMMDFYLASLTELVHLWDELEYVDGAYTADGLKITLTQSFRMSMQNATVTITFNDGEVASITVFDMLGEVVLSSIELSVGDATVTVPDTDTVHIHKNIYVVYEDRHLYSCACGSYNGGGSHRYDDDGVCECGAKNHQHTASGYVLDPYDIDYHYSVCECGVMLEQYEHDYGSGDTCAQCGEPKHTHNWVYGGEYSETGHWLKCSDCGNMDTKEHQFNGSECSVCGYTVHEHNWVVAGRGDFDSHKMRCSICQLESYESHDFSAGDVCSKCGAEKHVHTFKWYTSEYSHYGSCSAYGCYEYVDEPHEFGDDNICDVCGYEKHVHSIDIEGHDQYRHWGSCTGNDCPNGGYINENHSWNADNKCTVCGYEQLPINEHDWRNAFDSLQENSNLMYLDSKDGELLITYKFFKYAFYCRIVYGDENELYDEIFVRNVDGQLSGFRRSSTGSWETVDDVTSLLGGYSSIDEYRREFLRTFSMASLLDSLRDSYELLSYNHKTGEYTFDNVVVVFDEYGNVKRITQTLDDGTARSIIFGETDSSEDDIVDVQE